MPRSSCCVVAATGDALGKLIVVVQSHKSPQRKMVHCLFPRRPLRTGGEQPWWTQRSSLGCLSWCGGSGLLVTNIKISRDFRHVHSGGVDFVVAFVFPDFLAMLSSSLLLLVIVVLGLL